MGSAIELYTSRDTAVSADNPQVVLKYLLYGETDDTAADTLLQATAPATYRGLEASSYRLEPVSPGVWLGEVTYTTLDTSPSRSQGESWPGSLQGGTGQNSMNVTHSLATANAYAAAGYTAATTDFGGAINVTPGEGPNGVEIVMRAFRFTLKKRIADASVTSAYLTTVFGLTGCVNSAGYQPHAKLPSFAAGELLLEDVRFDQVSEDTWEFTYYFAASPNVTGLTVGDITGIAKKGWEYLWFVFGKMDVNGWVVQKPLKAYVEQVYPTAAFSGL